MGLRGINVATAVGDVSLKGDYNASTNTPDLDTSPSGVKKGDHYVVSVAGTFFSTALEVGDSIIAKNDNPTSVTHWIILQANLTASTIKTAYESNADTNEFDDAEQTKLAGIATAAIANLVEDTTPELGGNLDALGKDIDNIQNLIHDQSVSGTDIDFNEDEVQTISISVNTTFTTANRAIGKSKTLKITTDGTLRTLDFPAWKFVGAKPADQAASKIGILTLTCFGTADTDIVAAYAVEE